MTTDQTVGHALRLLLLVSIISGSAVRAQDIFPGPNINMVSGTTWPDGDPFLNKQNEGSMSVSTRNELHVAGGSNDYRTTDLPGLPEGKTIGDSWPSLYWSTDGGGRWKSTLLPGYPQDTSPLGAISPLKTALDGAGFEAGADPWVRFGASGLLSYSGIAFVRDTDQSAGFVATYMDLNNTETGNPFGYVGTALFDIDATGDSFIDLPRHAVDKPRAGAQMATLFVNAADGEIVPQTIECGNIYVGYARIRGDGTAAVNSDIMFTRSLDCGQTFSDPIVLSGPNTINQGAYVAVEPFSGDVQVAWRQFENATLNCTYEGEFYWESPEVWPVAQVEIAGVTYDSVDPDIFPPKIGGVERMPYQVLQELLAAWLNVLSGASRSAEVTAAMAAAEAWLTEWPPGSKPRHDDKAMGNDLRKLLRDYNLGKLELPMCASLEGSGSSGLNPDAIMVVRSTDFGQTFSAPVAATGDDFHPFEQGTTEFSFRTTSYPSMIFDNQGRSYIAVQTRGHASIDPDPVGGESRVAVTTSNNGVDWTPLQAIDDDPDESNHQIQPSLAFHRGELFALYYDFRNDKLPIFDRFIVDVPFDEDITFRHTTDVRVAVALPSDTPEFTNDSVLRESVQASKYPTIVVDSTDSSTISQQLKFSFPSFPISKGGSAAFFGDFTDIGIPQFYLNDSTNTWEYDIDPSRGAPVVHAIWTDNRDIVPPPEGFGWNDYVPPTYNFDVNGNPDPAPASFFDPTVSRAVCTPETFTADLTQMRNQNVYTSRITRGLAAGIPGNNRPLSVDLQRVFVAFVQNTTTQDKTFRLNIPFQPFGGKASFDQFAEDPLTTIDVVVGANSSVSESIYVTAIDPAETIEIEVFDIDTGIPTIAARLLINPDPTAPAPDEGNIALEEVYTPTIFNPTIFNPTIFNTALLGTGEVGVASPTIFNLAPGDDPDLAALMALAVQNPTIFNPTIFNESLFDINPANPTIFNPTIFNSTVATPTIFNPTIFNLAIFAIENPTIFNPTIFNPTIFNPTIFNQTVQGDAVEVSFVVENGGNATSAYSANFDVGEAPEGFVFQLFVYRTYTVPLADGCALTEEVIQETLVNELDPNVTGDLGDPDSTSFYIGPGDNVVVTLRILPDPDAPVPGDPATIDTPEELEITASIVPQGVDTPGILAGETQPTPIIVGDGTLPINEIQKLLASDGAAGDRFGNPAVDGDNAVIGAFMATDNGAQSGAAYYFRRIGGVWVEQAKLLPSDGVALDAFGFSVAVSGNFALVGMTKDNGNPGAAYLFDLTTASGVVNETAKLVASDGFNNDRLGHALDLDGTTAVVTAWGDDDNGTISGSAYVYFGLGSASGTVTESAKLLPSDGVSPDPLGDRFGRSVALDGNIVVISAPFDDDNGADSGSAYVFNISGAVGVVNEYTKLLPSDGATTDTLGANKAVALRFPLAVVGSRFDDDSGLNSGSAYVFNLVGASGVTNEAAKLLASDGLAEDAFGDSVVLDVIGPGPDLIFGTSDDSFRAVVTAPGDDDNGLGSGSAYLFDVSNIFIGATPTELGPLLPNDGAAGDGFGGTAAISVSTVLLGASFDDDSGADSGSAYAFTLPLTVTYAFTATGPGVISGTFGYDINTTDVNPGDPTLGIYPGSGFVNATVTGGVDDGLVINQSGLQWEVADSIQDFLAIIGPDPVNVNLTDYNGTAFSSDGLPPSLNLADFEEREIVIGGPTGRFYQITSLVGVSGP